MVKSILKEVIILALLCVAILLILGVLFYEYIPTNKIVPNKIAYQTPENVSQELSQNVVESTPVNITYSLSATDINVAKKENTYKPGKQDPFASITTTTTDANANTNTNSGVSNTTTTNQENTNSNNINNTTTNTNDENVSNSSGYLPNKGTK